MNHLVLRPMSRRKIACLDQRGAKAARRSVSAIPRPLLPADDDDVPFAWLSQLRGNRARSITAAVIDAPWTLRAVPPAGANFVRGGLAEVQRCIRRTSCLSRQRAAGRPRRATVPSGDRAQREGDP